MTDAYEARRKLSDADIEAIVRTMNETRPDPCPRMIFKPFRWGLTIRFRGRGFDIQLSRSRRFRRGLRFGMFPCLWFPGGRITWLR